MIVPSEGHGPNGVYYKVFINFSRIMLDMDQSRLGGIPEHELGRFHYPDWQPARLLTHYRNTYRSIVAVGNILVCSTYQVGLNIAEAAFIKLNPTAPLFRERGTIPELRAFASSQATPDLVLAGLVAADELELIERFWNQKKF